MSRKTEMPLPEFPIVCCASRPVGSGVLFLVGHRRITVRNHVSLIWDITEFADGQLPLGDVLNHLESLNHDRHVITRVMADLVELAVVIDSRSLYAEFHAETNNPMRFNSYLRIPDILALEMQPAPQYVDGHRWELPPTSKIGASDDFSCRSFAQAPLGWDEYGRLLAAANDQNPSAGNLRPLRYSLIVNQGIDDLDAAIYAYNGGAHEIVEIAPMSPRDPQVLYSLNDEQAIYNSAGIIVIAADVGRTSTKYANRGYRYALIEAGMAVERILTECRELRLASLVYGGFNDDALRSLISADPMGAIPLICLAVGRSSDVPNMDSETLNDLYSRLEPFVGPNSPVRWANLVQSKRDDLSFHQSLSAFAPTVHDSGSDVDDRLCGGTAASSLLARTKAIVEALERFCSGAVRTDLVGPQTVVNPSYVHSAFAPYAEEQISSQQGRLSRFDDDANIEWVQGTRLQSGENFYLPIDLAFYPLSPKKLGRPLVAYANSSGVAAHSSRVGARRNALLELCERDAILRAWYRNEHPASVDSNLWSPYIQRRARYWAAQGHELNVFEFHSAVALVIGVTLRSSSQFPFFCFGSAATFDNPTAAMEKAFHEAEVALAGYRREPHPEMVLAVTDVRTPLNHGLFFAQHPSAEIDEFFTTDTLSTELSGKGTIAELVEAWDPIEIDLDPAGKVPVNVVRVIAAKAVPINFGYGMEHWSHPELGPQRQPTVTPHFIA